MKFDSDVNYWVANPQHKMIFWDLYKRDTSRDKLRSTKFMYGIALLFHVDSQIIDIDYDERLKIVCDGIWKEYKNDFMAEIDLVKERMSKLDGGDTSGMRQMKQWNRIMDEKTSFITSLHYGEKTYKMIEEMLISNGKLFDEYDRIMKILSKEQIAGDRTKGGSQESLIEKGDI